MTEYSWTDDQIEELLDAIDQMRLYWCVPGFNVHSDVMFNSVVEVVRRYEDIAGLPHLIGKVER